MAKEQKKTEKHKKKKVEVKEGESKEYTVPLRRKFQKTPRYKRVPKAVKALKRFIARHMKIRDSDLRKIKIDKYLNEELWFRGIKKPPAKIKVKVKKQGDNVYVELAELSEKAKWKKEKEMKTRKEMKKKREEKKKEEEARKKAEEERKKAKEKKEEEAQKTGEEEKEKEEKKEAVKEEGLERAERKAKEVKHETKIKRQPKRQVRQALKK